MPGSEEVKLESAPPRPTTAVPLCSLILAAYNEQDNLQALYDQLCAVADREGIRVEFVFVDDGSVDRTFEIMAALHEKDPRVKALRLSRNFGANEAVVCGLKHARGDVAVLMATDLQDPPEVLHDFLARWRDGAQVVWAVRKSRQESHLRRALARIFYGLVRRFAIPTYPATGTGSFCLIDRAVIEAFNALPERNRVTFGLIAWTGFRQVEVLYVRPPRQAGRQNWTPSRQFKSAIDTFLAFSYSPVRFISMLGFIVSCLSLGGAIYVAGCAFLYGTHVLGWPSLMVVTLFLGGIQLVVLGMIGEYLWRILEEVRGRPLYIVQERFGFGDDGSHG